MKVDFERLHWENYPSTDTPINADNLNRLEEGVAGLYSDVAEIEEELGGGVGEYVTEWLDEHVDPVGAAVVVDNTLSITGAAADAKKTGDEIGDLSELETTAKTDLVSAINEAAQSGGHGLSDDAKQALLTLLSKVAYIDEDGQDYYGDLYSALYPLVSITATFNQGQNTVYDADTLDSLKQYLTVQAVYEDGATETVTNYELSGSLSTAVSTITVSYAGFTTTFSVNVTVITEYLLQNSQGPYEEGSHIIIDIDELNFSNGDYIEWNGDVTTTITASAPDSFFRIGNNNAENKIMTWGWGYKYLFYSVATDGLKRVQCCYNGSTDQNNSYSGHSGENTIRIDKDGLLINGVRYERSANQYRNLKTWVASQSELTAAIHWTTETKTNYIKVVRYPSEE